MTILFCDTETYSAVNLRTHGTHRYADGVEVMLFLYAIDDGPVECWDLTTGAPMPKELANPLHNPSVELVFQNSHFDRTVLRKGLGIHLPVSRFHDTMVQAMVHSLPGGLERIGQIIGLTEEQAKQKAGKKLIQLFCVPQGENKDERATRETHPEQWAEFISYGVSDVVAMREAYKKLPKWNYARKTFNRQMWELDQKINDRGFQCDVEFARAAIDAATEAQRVLKARVQDETYGAVDSATKRGQLLRYILEEHGVTLPDLTSDTLKRRLEDPELPESVRILIAIRLEAGMASSSKYKALINAVSPDGRLRNALQFAGALRTNRWAGRIFQPQNMKRPDMTQEQIDLVIEAVKAGCLDLITDEPMRALANAVRGCIVAPEGKKLCIADLSNIEGRVLVWLATEAWKLQAFRDVDNGTGHDMYKLAYARAFNCDPNTVTKAMRQIGKVMELALGYEGGVGAFLTFAAVYQMDLDELAAAVWATASAEVLEHGENMYNWTVKKGRSTFGLEKNVWIACEVLKKLWRDAHPEVVSLWAQAADAMRRAVTTPGVCFPVGKHIRVQRDGAWTRVRLPSGRYMCYLNLECDDKGQLSYTGVNSYTRQWGRIKTYGGKLVENWTQACAFDVMCSSMPEAERRGYEIVLSVHDEEVTETPDNDEYSSDELAEIMATVPQWAPGLPLAAAGFEAQRYKKE